MKENQNNCDLFLYVLVANLRLIKYLRTAIFSKAKIFFLTKFIKVLYILDQIKKRKMPASKKDLKKAQQKKNVAAGVGDDKGRLPSNNKVNIVFLLIKR